MHSKRQPIEIAVGIKASARELAAMTPEARQAFLVGIAKIIQPQSDAAKADRGKG